MNKNIFKFISVSILLGIFVFSSCTNSLEDRTYSSSGYGSLKLVKEVPARALDVQDITTATVTVSGYGMEDIVSSETIAISGGTGTASIEKIPVGKNRIVTVKSNLDGAVTRALVDIEAGDGNSVSVTWSSTAIANVYYALLKNNSVNISSYGDTEKSEIQALIPDVHASLVNASKIASDYSSGTKSSESDYILTHGTVEVTTTGVSGYTIQVTDIASEEVKPTSDSEATSTLDAYPGSWKVYVYDTAGTLVSTKGITVVSGKTSTVDVTLTKGSTFTAPTDSIVLYVPTSSNYNHVYAWTESGSNVTEYSASWSGDELSNVSGDYYVYTISHTSSNVILNNGSSGSGNQTSNLTISNAGAYLWNGSAFDEDYNSGTTEDTLTVNVTSASSGGNGSSGDDDFDGVKIYVSAESAPTIWVWQPDGLETTKLMGYTWNSQPTMESATDLNYNPNWYVFEIENGNSYYTEGKTFSFILNKGSTITTTKTATFWYDATGAVGTSGTYYDKDPTTKPEPVLPTVTIKPSDGHNVSTKGSIFVSFTDGNDTVTSAKVTINGTPYSISTTAGTYTFALSDLGITEDGNTITVNASVTNSKGTATATATLTSKASSVEDTFDWDNANVYFVLTDRFYNGDTKNDHSYYRQNADNNSNVSSSYYNVATFHGGDIAGLTAKLDYFDDLGVNAIWITAPYEQAHGWCTGGGNGFPHYAFHGYYTLDWTYMDQNMGTLEEFRTFVNACHSKGIRVIMDVVMNHCGYNTVEDMMTYKFGHYSAITKSHGWCANEGSWTANPDSSSDSDYWTNSYWDNTWWGCWIRSFGYSSYDQGGDLLGSLSGLPDVRTEMTDTVTIPTFLQTKWAAETDSTTVPISTGNTLGNTYGDYKLPTVSDVDWYNKSGDWRTDLKGAPSDYQVIWLSGWVRELGIDGFRCDTAKHVHMYRWGQLKDACQSALEAWRSDTSKSKTSGEYDGSAAADWDESFWMTGECFGWTSTAGSGDYYTTGKFDSMINFSFNGSAGSGTSSSYPSTSTWSSYLSINSNADSDGNGNRNNVLTYVSSHDTKLCRVSDQKAVGTMLQLTPGGIQIYYGDENSRSLAYTGCGDTDMMTRGDMDFNSNTDCITHWGKVGKFRKYNPAVGAGTGTAYKRSYSGAAGENKVAISISSTSVDVSGLFSDGTTVYNWYDGTSTTVSSGTATFSSSSASVDSPVLVSDRNPSDYDVTF